MLSDELSCAGTGLVSNLKKATIEFIYFVDSFLIYNKQNFADFR